MYTFSNLIPFGCSSNVRIQLVFPLPDAPTRSHLFELPENKLPCLLNCLLEISWFFIGRENVCFSILMLKCY